MTKYLFLLLALAIPSISNAQFTVNPAPSNGVSSSSAAATYVNKAGDTMTGPLNGTYINGSSATFTTRILSGPGSAAAPAYSYTSDGNTGFYNQTNDTLSAAANGLRVFTQDSVGNVNFYSATTNTNFTLNIISSASYQGGGSQQLIFNDGAVQTGTLLNASGAMYMDSNRGSVNIRSSNGSGGAAAGLTIAANTQQAQMAGAGGATVTYGLDVGTFTVGGSTLIVAGTGIISAPSQPRCSLNTPVAASLNASAYTRIFWTLADQCTQSMWNIASASGTITIPATGWYHVYAQAEIPALLSVANDQECAFTGNLTKQGYAVGSVANSGSICAAIYDGPLTAGNAVQFAVYHNNATALTAGTNANKNFFSVTKIW